MTMKSLEQQNILTYENVDVRGGILIDFGKINSTEMNQFDLILFY